MRCPSARRGSSRSASSARAFQRTAPDTSPSSRARSSPGPDRARRPSPSSTSRPRRLRRSPASTSSTGKPRASIWVTPAEKFFHVGHYGVPEVDAAKWKLQIAGHVARPTSYDLAALKALPKKEVVFTLECSGNHGFPFLPGAIGNARWGGAPLAAVLQKAGRKPAGVEVVFYGADQGEEPIQYIGGLGDKMGEFKARAPFARSMSWAEATDPANLLCYEMNGKPLPAANGAPLRLIAPRWFGISNVKWLTRIEVIDSRFEGPFQAQRYLTVREVPHGDGTTVWTRTAVGKSLLKSVAARVAVVDGKHRIYGAAWGAPIARVEVKVDDGPWKNAVIDKGAEHEFAWKFWHLDWPSPSAGEHKITSRAIDKEGNVQPAQDDPFIAGKRTYWEANGQITRTIKIA